MMGPLANTKDLARRLKLSEHTVQDHLKSIFDKAAAGTRHTLLSRALGVSVKDQG